MIYQQHLHPDSIHHVYTELHTRNPVGYFVIDNFIDEPFFSKILHEFEQQNHQYFLTDVRSTPFMSNKTLLLGTQHFLQLYNFFLSDEFGNFLQQVFGSEVKKAKKITSEWVEERLGVGGQGIAQIYEKDDFMDWHTDLAKDLQRKQAIQYGGYALWNAVTVHDYDEVGAFIYYVYTSKESWSSIDGGVLELGRFDGNNITPYEQILPCRNRLVLIKSSNSSYHRVTPVVSETDYRVSIQDLVIQSYANLGPEHLV